MPIYGYGVIGAPWTICKEMDKKQLFCILESFIEMQHKLTKFGHETFIKTLDFNTEMNECYIATYSIGKSNIDEYNYMKCMEELLSLMNAKYKRGKNSIYKFDIIGTWTNGKIVVMVKK